MFIKNIIKITFVDHLRDRPAAIDANIQLHKNNSQIIICKYIILTDLFE